MRRIIHLIFIGLLTTATVGPLTGCEDEATVDEDDRAQINRIFQTGVDQKDDAFVRAETLRVLELLQDPRLNGFAEPRLNDPSPMVRAEWICSPLRERRASSTGPISWPS